MRLVESIVTGLTILLLSSVGAELADISGELSPNEGDIADQDHCNQCMENEEFLSFHCQKEELRCKTQDRV